MPDPPEGQPLTIGHVSKSLNEPYWGQVHIFSEVFFSFGHGDAENVYQSPFFRLPDLDLI